MPCQSRLHMANIFAMIGWCAYHLTLEAEESGYLPLYPGSMLRGAFGHALKRLVCVMRHRPCEGCPLEHSCIYTTVFETRPNPDAGIMRLYNHAPHPFVLSVAFRDNPRIEAGDHFEFEIRLFGSAMAAAPFVLRAFDEAAQRGLGKARVPFRLVSVRNGNEGRAPWKAGLGYPSPFERPPPTSRADVFAWEVATPLRMKQDGKLANERTLQASALAMTIVRRLGLIQSFFAPDTPQPDFQHLKAQSARLKIVDQSLRWKELIRRSSRQRTTQSISGLVGRIVIDASQAPDWPAYLAWAPILHVGKGTSMGLGRMIPQS